MPRNRLILDSASAFHVTARSNNKDWFYLSIDNCWTIFSDVLSRISGLYEVEFHALVLMSNHFHLILSSRAGNISYPMRYLMTEVSRAINRETGRLNHVFGNRYKWSILRNSVDYAYVYKYVLRNPVRAGLVESVEKYEYSSLSRLMIPRLSFPVVENSLGLWSLIPKAISDRLEWLNVPTSKEEEALVKRGLNHFNFKLPSGNSYRHQLKRLRLSYGVERS